MQLKTKIKKRHTMEIVILDDKFGRFFDTEIIELKEACKSCAAIRLDDCNKILNMQNR